MSEQEYRAALEDFRDRGLRCDLNPTMPAGGWDYVAWSEYLRRADEGVRERAARALEDAEPDPEVKDLHFLTASIKIIRVISETGQDQHRVETSPGMSMIEALGMLRLAEHSVMTDDEDDL